MLGFGLTAETSDDLMRALQEAWSGYLTIQGIKRIVDPACLRTIAKYQYN